MNIKDLYKLNESRLLSLQNKVMKASRFYSYHVYETENISIYNKDARYIFELERLIKKILSEKYK